MTVQCWQVLQQCKVAKNNPQIKKTQGKDGCGNGPAKGSDLLFPFHLIKESIRMPIAFLRPWQFCKLPFMTSALKEGGAWCPSPAGRCLFSSRA